MCPSEAGGSHTGSGLSSVTYCLCDFRHISSQKLFPQIVQRNPGMCSGVLAGRGDRVTAWCPGRAPREAEDDEDLGADLRASPSCGPCFPSLAPHPGTSCAPRGTSGILRDTPEALEAPAPARQPWECCRPTGKGWHPAPRPQGPALPIALQEPCQSFSVDTLRTPGCGLGREHGPPCSGPQGGIGSGAPGWGKKKVPRALTPTGEAGAPQGSPGGQGGSTGPGLTMLPPHEGNHAVRP